MPKREPIAGWESPLRAIRKERRMKLYEAAREIGIDKQHLSNIELVHCLPNLALAFKIAAFYGTSIEALWKRTAVDPPTERPDQLKLFTEDEGEPDCPQV